LRFHRSTGTIHRCLPHHVSKKQKIRRQPYTARQSLRQIAKGSTSDQRDPSASKRTSRLVERSPRSPRFARSAGIVARAAIFSEGGRDTFSKAPTASNSVICLRIELPLGPEPAWYSGADSRTTRALSSPRGTVSDWNFRTSSFYGTNFVLMSSNAQQRVA
jgi:hypothetical protein